MVLHSRTLCQRKMLSPGETGYRVCQAPWALGSGQREGAGLLEMGSVAVRIVLSSGSVA